MINLDERKKRVAVISSGFGLLGKAIGEQLLADGFLVVLLFHQTGADKAKEISASYSSPDIFALRCDVANHVEVAKTIEKIEKEIGSIYIGIHCAQTPILRKKTSELDLATFKNQFDVPVFGGFNFFVNIASYLKARRQGILIGLTTIAIESEESSGNFGGYLAAKSALKGLLKELAHELKPYNIAVHALAPGFVPGGINRDIPPRFIEMRREKFPDEQILSSQDIAKSVSSLCRRPFDKLTVVVDKSQE